MIMTRKNNLVIHSFATTEAENEVIQKKMKLFGIKNKSTFFRVKTLHEHGSIYETEIDDIKQRVDEIWIVFRKILSRLDHADD